MSLSKYILRGQISATASPFSGASNQIELLVWLDAEAQAAPSDALAKAKRQYAIEARKAGGMIEWAKPVLALPAPEVKASQLLFSFPGVQVYELTNTGNAGQASA